MKVKSLNNLKKYKIGLRTIKTGIAVGLSLYIASLFNLKTPLFVAIGAIATMQSSVSESFKTGKNRMVATFFGALIGLTFSYIMPNNYVFIGLGIILLIYIHTLLGWKTSVTLSAVVFLAIYQNNEGARLSYAINRLLDTFIGITISMLINYFIANPNIKEAFRKSKFNISNICKNLVYNLVTTGGEISLDDFSKEAANFEKTFSLYKQELEMNVAKKKISARSTRILTLLDDIYHELLVIIKLDMKANLNEENVALFKELYSEDFVSHEKDDNALDIVYNYHLTNIFNNLIEIDNLLKESSGN